GAVGDPGDADERTHRARRRGAWSRIGNEAQDADDYHDGAHDHGDTAARIAQIRHVPSIEELRDLAGSLAVTGADSPCEEAHQPREAVPEARERSAAGRDRNLDDVLVDLQVLLGRGGGCHPVHPFASWSVVFAV